MPIQPAKAGGWLAGHVVRLPREAYRVCLVCVGLHPPKSSKQPQMPVSHSRGGFCSAASTLALASAAAALAFSIFPAHPQVDISDATPQSPPRARAENRVSSASSMNRDALTALLELLNAARWVSTSLRRFPHRSHQCPSSAAPSNPAALYASLAEQCVATLASVSEIPKVTRGGGLPKSRVSRNCTRNTVNANDCKDGARSAVKLRELRISEGSERSPVNHRRPAQSFDQLIIAIRHHPMVQATGETLMP